MLHTPSLYIALAVLMATVFVLFYFVTYRSSRAPYAGWWCASLGLQALARVFYLWDGTPQRVWANPVAITLDALGMGCIWAASRSLRGRRTPWWWLAVAPLLVGILAVMDDPATTPWPAGAAQLASIWILLALASVDLWFLARSVPPTRTSDQRVYRQAVWGLFAACAGAALFYVGRWTAFIAVGPERPPFTTVFGENLSTLMLVVLMTAVAFNMSTVCDEQQKRTLRDLAAHDGLTGLLNRKGFLHLAEDALLRHRGGGQLILADLDHFKTINDTHGHAAGDRAIVTFAGVCQSLVRSTDLVGRYGGEEFILLLPGASPERADDVVETISLAMARRARTGSTVLPTVSFGIAPAEMPLAEAIEHADQALYVAKETGRDRAIHYARTA
ncbi:GGDEF domain-containing protein [Nocardioides seonyuensis]|uniref:GGDEF domain-containing protein n=1 Tax=Nocardioides seonyuensis TaxID=2518371 RepID=A0A4P7IEY9_9ACTN|nr:GGDEF domain-containing protein [Nocardioides seonyuensis]QBX55330.1 GGDEF domain-containing protein [Nocardioides seonyuensis]